MEDDNTEGQNPDANDPLPMSKTSEDVEMSDHDPISDHTSDNEKPKKPLAGTPLKSALKNLNKNISVLRRHLKLSADEEWKTWLRSPNFLPYWEELWFSWLSKQAKKYRGPGIEQVLSVMRAEAEDFDEKHVDKTEWDDIHHYANFMHQILRRNLNHTDGLFKHRPMGPNEAEAYLWATMKCIQHKFSPSQRDRPSGGKALLYGEMQKRKIQNQATDDSTPRKSKKQARKGYAQNPISDEADQDDELPKTAPSTVPESDHDHVVDESDVVELATDIDEITSLINRTLTDSWKKMIRSYAREKYPEKQSESFDLSDPYWRLMFARTALHRADQDCSNETQIPLPPDEEVSDANSQQPSLDDESAGLDPSEAVWRGSVTDAPIFELAVLDSERNDGETITDNNSLEYLEFEEIAAEQEYGEKEDITPNHLLTVSEETLANYQKELIWLDNPGFQPTDFDHAHRSLYLTPAEEDDDRLIRTRHRYMRANNDLEIWQVLGVARIIEIMEKTRPDGSPMFRGVFISDVMGLGKTFQATVFMLEIYRRAKLEQTAWESSTYADPTECGPEPKYRPFLLIVPSALLSQWVSEIDRITQRLKVFVLYGNPKSVKAGTFKNAQVLKNPLTPSHPFFDGSFSRSNHVVVTTYDTFRNRHGPPSKRQWANKEAARRRKEGASYVEKPWPGDIEGLFQHLILDEAHTLRNAESGLSTAVHWVQADFHLLLSATIFYNGISDFRGYMSLIIPEKADAIWDDALSLRRLDVTKSTNPFLLPKDHPARYLRFTHYALKKFVFTDQITIQVASVHLKDILQHMNIRRTLSSSIQIGSKHLIIGSRIPPSQTRIIHVEFSRDEKKMYDRAVIPHYKNLIMKKDGKVVVNMAKYRMLTLLTSWLGMEFAEELLTVKTFKDILSLFRLKTVCQSLARVVYSRKPPAVPGTWFRRTRRRGKITQPSVNALRTLLRGSPKMRAMLPIVIHNALIRQEKQIIWCAFPATQVYVAAVLKECGIDAKVFHSKLDQSQRQVLINEFTTTDKCSILVMSLAVNALGLNLHPRCSIMHFFDMPATKSVMDQAIGRLRRFGQQLVVVAYVYSVTNSWNVTQQAKADEKAVTSMLCDLNPAMFKLAVENTEEISISNLVVRDGMLYQLEPGEVAMPSDNTNDEDIIAAIQKSFVEEVGSGIDTDI